MFLINKFKALYESTVKKFNSFKQSRESGSGRVGNPRQNLKNFIMIIICLFVSLLVYALSGEDKLTSNGVDELKKEDSVYFNKTRIKIDEEESDNDQDYQLEFDKESVDELAACPDIIKKVKEGTQLSLTEKDLVEDCLNSDYAIDLTDDQKAVLRALATNDNLTQKEKDWLRNNIDNPLAAKLVKALNSDDPNKRKAAKMIMNNPNLTKKEIEALAKVADGTITDQDVIDALTSDDPAIRAKALEFLEEQDPVKKAKLLKELKKQIRDSSEITDIEDVNQGEAIESAKKLRERIAKRQKKIDAQKKKVEDLRKKLEEQGVFDKIAKGIPLTKEEQELLDDYLKEKNILEELQKEQDKDIELLNKIIKAINKDLVALGMKPLDFIGNYSELSKPKPSHVDADGNVVTPEEIRKLRLYQEQLADTSDFEGSLLSPLLGLSLKDSKTKADDLVSSLAPDLEKIQLPIDLRIPVIKESAIYVSSGSSAGRRVVFRFADHVYDPESGDVLIPMGSKLIGKTGNFDLNTKLMEVTDLNRVIIGNKEFNIKFVALSANGAIGIPGGVKDTKDVKVTVALLSEFASATSQFFSEFIQRQVDLNTGLNPLTAITSAGLSAGGAGFEKLSEILVNDIQKAESIFFSPGNMKMIVSPD